MQRVLKIYLRIVLIVLLLSFFVLPTTASKGIIGFCLVTALMCALYFFVYEKKSLRWHSWITPSTILVISLLIVYYQWLLDYLVGYRTKYGFAYPQLMNHYAVISTVGMIALVEGYTFKNRKENINKKHFTTYGNNFFLVTLQVILFALFVYNINVTDFLTGNDYSGTHALGVFTYIEYFLQAVNIAIMISAINKSSKENTSLGAFIGSIPVLSIIVMSLYLILRLFSGDRGPVIDTVLALFFSYLYYSKRKFSLPVIIVTVFIGAYGVSLLGMARNYDTNQSFFDRMAEAANVFSKSGRFEDSRSVSPATLELAFSHLSYEVMVGGMVADEDGYKYGTYQLVALANTIPFFNGFLHRTFNLSKNQTSSSYYATYKYIGDNPTWGLGTNCMGDFFMDFGIWGVLLGMFVVGLAFRLVDQTLFVFDKSTVTSGMLAFAIVYASKSLYIGRSNFLGEFKLFVFLLLILWVSSFFTGKKNVL